MKNEKDKFTIAARIKSFKYAFNGLWKFFKFEHNARIHLVAAAIAILLSFYLEISATEWVAILSVICAVFVAEIFNSSIEKLADVVSPEINPQIKTVKDMAAAAVLITACLAILIGGIIFLPKLF
ncbi:diacylglycerol kinase [Pedobacter lithocola]|uniref:Diacylglycerol kinase n=1 Tax=Pedobacter lithocola TaxID=1908239 RepID=A0ABV8P512_9SPHI